jgi:hypothetical protein
MNFDESERMTKLGIKETVAKWKDRLKQEPCEDCISRANALRVAKNEYLRGWHNALCKALSEKYSIHCEEGNFNVIQEETITGLGLSMNCALGKDVENYMSAMPSVKPTRKKGKWITNSDFPDEIICSCCNTNYDMWFWEQGTMKYCPHCGAEMESEE